MSIIGIDLGTTNSLVAVWLEGKTQLLPNALGENITPSIVSLDEKNQILIGRPAAERLITHPDRTVANFKRYMGTNKTFQLGNQKFKPEDLSSFVLRSLKADAEHHLNMEIHEAVISVPAYFNDIQRKATKVAGELAGLKVERLINEPTAAAVAYGQHESGKERTILVFDLGGGTFDVSILEIYDSVMEVRATAGDNYLGGEDFLNLIVQSFIENNKLNKDKLSPQELNYLHMKAEKCKRMLSLQEIAEIKFDIGGKSIEWTISRKEFEKLSESLVNRVRVPVERALRDALIKPKMLDSVMLVGGGTKMPLMRSLVSRMFGCLPTHHIDPEEVVARGAAIQGGLKSLDTALNEIVLTDVCPYSLGVACNIQMPDGSYIEDQFLPLIERNTTVPTSRVHTFCTNHPKQSQINVRVYQGESRLLNNNLKLGELLVNLKPKQEHQEINIRFTYDINGMLEIEVVIVATNEKYTKVLFTNSETYSDEMVKERLQELEKLKMHPRDQLENRTLLAKGERLFEEILGEERHFLQQELHGFEMTLERQDRDEIAKARTRLRTILEKLEVSFQP